MPKKPLSPTPGFREEPASFNAEAYVPPLKSTTEIGKDGRIVIPAAMREAMGIRDGSTLVLLVKDEILEVFTAEAGFRRLQEWVKRVVPADVSLVEELYKERREWAAEEDRD